MGLWVVGVGWVVSRGVVARGWVGCWVWRWVGGWVGVVGCMAWGFSSSLGFCLGCFGLGANGKEPPNLINGSYMAT